MGKTSLLLCLLVATIAIGIGVLVYVFARGKDESVAKSNRTHNKYIHAFDDPDVAIAELESAWKRFQTARGVVPRTDGNPVGLTDQQIDDLEQKMRQRFPADLKAFLKIYLSHGGWFNDLEFTSPDALYSNWHDRTSIGLDTSNSIRYGGGDGEPNFCDHCVFIFASEHLEDIGYDLRTGKIIEVCDCDSGWIADSLAGLLNELASHCEQGRTISRYDGEIEDRPDADQYRTGILNSVMWYAYERPPADKELP